MTIPLRLIKKFFGNFDWKKIYKLPRVFTILAFNVIFNIK